MTTSAVDSVTRRRVTHETGAVIPSVSRGRVQGAHADQVVRRGGEQELPVHAPSATVPELAQSADGLHPTEDFFDAFAGTLTEGIAGMPGGPRIERATGFLLGDMHDCHGKPTDTGCGVAAGEPFYDGDQHECGCQELKNPKHEVPGPWKALVRSVSFLPPRPSTESPVLAGGSGLRRRPSEPSEPPVPPHCSPPP